MIKTAYASAADTAAIIRLWKEAFGDDEPYTSWYFTNVFRPERTFCLYLDDQLVSVIQFAPYQLFLHGDTIPVAYLVGVCTDPPYQGQGYASTLMNWAIGQLRRDYQLLMLYTDIPAFYHPFGFTHCYQLHRYHLPAAATATLPEKWRKGTLEPDDIAIYQHIYQQMTADFDGYILRDTQNWHNYLADFLCGDGGLYLTDTAYLLWFIDEDHTTKIKEIGYSNQLALAEAKSAAGNIAQANNLPSIVWDAPYALNVPGLKGITVPHVMAMDCRSTGSAAAIRQSTQSLFGPSDTLWINEIT